MKAKINCQTELAFLVLVSIVWDKHKKNGARTRLEAAYGLECGDILIEYTQQVTL